MKFDELCEIEPRLRPLEMECKEIRALEAPGERLDAWYQTIKPRLVQLVGWEVENERLNSATIYEFAYLYLLDVAGA